MRPRISLLAIATLALLSTAVTTAQSPDWNLPPDRAISTVIPAAHLDAALLQLDTLVTEAMGATGIPGLAVAVVHGEEVLLASGYGVRRVGESAAVDADTVFQLASLSKSLAATVVASQVGQGALTWDTPVAELLPWFELSDQWVTQHVTVGDLFSHRSGLPGHAGDDLEDLGFDRRQVLERLRYLPLEPFRTTYLYTNFGLTAAAEAVAAAAGLDWADLSRVALYGPLGMDSTSSRHSDYVAHANHAATHVPTESGYQAIHSRQPDAQSPAGGASSSVNDMARWLSLLIQDGVFQGEQLVATDALTQAITPQVISNPAGSSRSRAAFYGYGFNVGTTPAGLTSISHSGAFLLGAGTHFMVIPELDVGIVVLTNAAPVGAAEAIAASFMDLVQFGQVTRDWLAGYSALMEAVLAPVGNLVGVHAPADPAPSADPGHYTGNYANDYFGKIEIAPAGDGLLLIAGPAALVYPLRHWDGHTFVFTPTGENAPVGSISRVEFASGDGDRALSVYIEFLDGAGQGWFQRE